MVSTSQLLTTGHSWYVEEGGYKIIVLVAHIAKYAVKV
jgi:hypothetical protein